MDVESYPGWSGIIENPHGGPFRKSQRPRNHWALFDGCNLDSSLSAELFHQHDGFCGHKAGEPPPPGVGRHRYASLMLPPQETFTPTDLARELDIDPKRLRTWLRKNAPRAEADLGDQWALSSAEADLVRNAFAPSTSPNSPGFDPGLLTVGEILHAYTALLGELRHRGLVRTNNAPIGDLAEYACAAYYEGALAPNSEKSYDLIAVDGRRVQVKVRNVREDTSPSAVFSSIRSMDFDVCVFILANTTTNSVEAAYEWTADEIRSHGRYTTHTNSTLVRIGKVRSGVAGTDITNGLDAAWQAMLELAR